MNSMMKIAIFTFGLVAYANANECTEVCQGDIGPVGPAGPIGATGPMGPMGPIGDLNVESLSVDNLIVGGNLAGGGLYINGPLTLTDSDGNEIIEDVANFLNDMESRFNGVEGLVGTFTDVYGKVDTNTAGLEKVGKENSPDGIFSRFAGVDSTFSDVYGKVDTNTVGLEKVGKENSPDGIFSRFSGVDSTLGDVYGKLLELESRLALLEA